MYHWIVSVGGGERFGVQAPIASLRTGVVAGVAVVLLTQSPQVAGIKPVPPFVLGCDAVEGPGPHIGNLVGLMVNPGGRPHGPGSGVAADRLLQFGAQHECAVVAPGLDVGHRRQQCHAAGGASGLVPGSRPLGQRRFDRGGQCAPMPLAGEEFAERVPHVHDVDVSRSDPGRREGLRQHGAHQLGGVETLAGEVAREVGLGAAQDPRCRHADAPTVCCAPTVTWR